MSHQASAAPPPLAMPTGLSKTSLFFGALMITAAAWFLYWGLGYTNNNHVLLFVLATLFGVFMAFNIGGNEGLSTTGIS